MSSIDNKCLLCESKSSCFKQLSENELDLISPKRVELRYKKGEIIAKQGSFVTHVLFVQKGLTKVYKEINDKDNLILNLYPKGTLINLPTLFRDDFLQYSVAAIEDTTICAIDKKEIEHLVLTNGEFAKSIISTMSKCTYYHFDKFVSLTQKQINGRIAEALLFLAKFIYYSDKFHLSLTRKDIAEFTGLSVMSVVRALKDFKESGLINDENGTIELLQKDSLLRISELG
jgi:CRP/FNR family transcriptional regulator